MLKCTEWFAHKTQLASFHEVSVVTAEGMCLGYFLIRFSIWQEMRPEACSRQRGKPARHGECLANVPR